MNSQIAGFATNFQEYTGSKTFSQLSLISLQSLDQIETTSNNNQNNHASGQNFNEQNYTKYFSQPNYGPNQQAVFRISDMYLQNLTDQIQVLPKVSIEKMNNYPQVLGKNSQILQISEDNLNKQSRLILQNNYLEQEQISEQKYMQAYDQSLEKETFLYSNQIFAKAEDHIKKEEQLTQQKLLKSNQEQQQQVSTVDQEQVRKNFENLLAKVYAIIQDIQNKNEKIMVTRAKNQKKLTQNSKVIGFSVLGHSLNSPSLEYIRNQSVNSLRNPNHLKSVPKLELHRKNQIIKKNKQILEIDREHHLDERLNTVRSECSRRSNKSHKGICVISAKKQQKGGLLINRVQNLQGKNIYHDEKCQKFAKAKLMNKIKNYSLNKQKKINVCQKLTFKHNKQNAENSKIATNLVKIKGEGIKTSKKKQVGSSTNTKIIEFRLF